MGGSQLKDTPLRILSQVPWVPPAWAPEGPAQHCMLSVAHTSVLQGQLWVITFTSPGQRSRDDQPSHGEWMSSRRPEMAVASLLQADELQRSCRCKASVAAFSTKNPQNQLPSGVITAEGSWVGWTEPVLSEISLCLTDAQSGATDTHRGGQVLCADNAEGVTPPRWSFGPQPIPRLGSSIFNSVNQSS